MILHFLKKIMRYALKIFISILLTPFLEDKQTNIRDILGLCNLFAVGHINKYHCADETHCKNYCLNGKKYEFESC